MHRQKMCKFLDSTDGMFALKGIQIIWEASGHPPSSAGDRRGGGDFWADINWEQSGQIGLDIADSSVGDKIFNWIPGMMRLATRIPLLKCFKNCK